MALDEDKMFDGRLDVDIAIREGGCDAVFNLDVLGESGDFTDFGIREDVHFAACVLEDVFAHGKKMAESVTPVAKALGAVSVIREAGKKVFLQKAKMSIAEQDPKSTVFIVAFVETLRNKSNYVTNDGEYSN